MKKFYSFDEIKQTADCIDVAKNMLGLPLDSNNRCAATWRGGDNPTAVSFVSEGWYDHIQEEGGSVIDLVAKVMFNGNIQHAQQALGERYGLQHKKELMPSRLPGEAPCNRKETLEDDGYKETARYRYEDKDGNLLHQVIRLEHPEKPKEFVQANAQGRFSMKGVDMVLYNLPRVANGSWAIVVEGEKDADTLIEWGLPATTNAGGAKKWQDSYTETLAGKDIVILPDNDEAGLKHAYMVAAHIKDVAKSIRIITLSQREKGDVTDWKEDGGNKFRLYRKLKKTPPLDVNAIPSMENTTFDARKQEAKEANRYPLSNYFLVEEEMPNGQRKKVPKPRKPHSIIEDCHKRFLGFPRKVGESMFDHDKDTKRIFYIDGTSSLFSWIQRKSGNTTDFKQQSNFITKHELFEGLHAEAKRYEAISHVPDHPKRPDVYYSHEDLPPPSEGHEYFERLVKFFAPASETYDAFLRAFFMAPLFYEYSIPRPMWIIDSEDGPGTGKTTIAEMAAFLYGKPPFKIHEKELKYNVDEIVKRLVTPDGRLARVFLLDNVTGVFESPELASFITQSDITGKAPYGRTEETRPNNLTYVITSNSATVDNDLGIRSFYIMVRRSNVSALWKTDIRNYVAKNRLQIFADMIDILQRHEREPFTVEPTTRFPEFEVKVLQAACRDFNQYADAIHLLAEARSTSNSDEEVADRVEDIIKAELVEMGIDPGKENVFLGSSVLKKWLAEDVNGNPTQVVRNLAKSGLLKQVDSRIRRVRQAKGRVSGTLWVCPDSVNEADTLIHKAVVVRGREVVSEIIDNNTRSKG